MNNSIYDVDYTRALPIPLKNDETMLALANAIAGELQENVRMSRLAVIYPRIDELSEDLLDILAYDLHVDWYEYDSPVSVKREILKDSVKVHKRIGTKYAVESVIKAHFGSGIVREWFEYGGEPHHFKIISGNPSLTNERIKEFLSILGAVKRKSSWLDAILITLTGEMELSAGVMFRDINREAHIMGSQDYINLYMGAILDECTAEAHIIGADDTHRAYYGIMLGEHATEAHAMGGGRYNAVHGTMLYERASEKHTI